MVRILIYSEIQVPQFIFTPSLRTSSEEGNEGRGDPCHLCPCLQAFLGLSCGSAVYIDIFIYIICV